MFSYTEDFILATSYVMSNKEQHFSTSSWFFMVPVRGPCGLPLDEGICTAICPRWYYDASVGCCLPFTYGCCCENDNNFKTRQLCENVCSENNRGRLCKFNCHVNHLYDAIKALQHVFCLNKLLFWGIELVVFL